MGKRTSLYLSDELDEACRASGVPLAELVRRGLSAGGPVDEATLRRVLAEVLPASGYATPGGTVGAGTAEVPLPAHATPGGTGATRGGTPKKAATKRAAPEPGRTDPPAAETPAPVADVFPAPRLPRWRG